MNYDYKRLFEILDRDFYDKIENKDVKNDHRLMVCFSGIPGSGKTTLAEKIQERYNGVIVDKNQMRTVVYGNEDIKDVKDVEDILDEYNKRFIERITKIPNGLLIMDSSVDRKFDQMKGWAEEYGYQILLVRCDIDRELAEERLQKEENKEGVKWFMAQMDRWVHDFEEFNKTSRPDFIWENKDESQLPELYAKLDEILGI